jgi:hypothetical protein
MVRFYTVVPRPAPRGGRVWRGMHAYNIRHEHVWRAAGDQSRADRE